MRKQLFKTVILAVTVFLFTSCSSDDSSGTVDNPSNANNILRLYTNNEALENVYYLDIDGDWHVSPTTNNGTMYFNQIRSMELVSYVKIKTDEAVSVLMSLNATNNEPLLDENSCYELYFDLNEEGIMILGDLVKVDCSN